MMPEPRQGEPNLENVEPKKIWVAMTLIPAIRDIEKIFAYDNPLHAVQPLISLIMISGEKARADLKVQFDRLMVIYEDSRTRGNISFTDMVGLGSEVMDYFHRQFLSEFGIHPRYGSSGKLGENPDGHK